MRMAKGSGIGADHLREVRSGIIDFLKGLNLPIDALGTGRIALLKDVRSGITDFKRGWKSELARRLALFEGRPQQNHRFSKSI